jgi:hypothetical protein
VPGGVARATEPPPPVDPRCDVRSTNEVPNPCADTGYIGFTKTCPKTGEWGICQTSLVAPDAEVWCDAIDGGVVCEAWPQSNHFEYQYVWTSPRGVIAPASMSPYDPIAYGECSGHNGLMRVTVVGPSGLSDVATAVMDCSGQ